MNNYKYLLEKNGLKIDKLTIKGKATLIETPLGRFVIKPNKDEKIYSYLLSRGFDYFPKIVDMNSNYVLMKYIEDVDYPKEEKAKDFIKILSLLHNKTSYFVITNNDEYKKIYEDVVDRINYINKYYIDLINNIESKEYPSPNEYLLLRNISIILSAINFCQYKINEWYENTKNNNKKRVCTIYNNIDINNLLRSKEYIYLLSLDNTKIDTPILDLYNFYKMCYDKYDFESLLKYYESFFPLLSEERNLLIVLICIPDRIEIDNSVYNAKKIKKSINRSYSLVEFLKSYETERTETHQEKNN